MLWSKLFIPTLREKTGAEGFRVLLRAGYMRQVTPHGYSYLLLGRRSLEKIGELIREEMERLGAQQMLWTEPHDEAIAGIARGSLRSYKQLPQVWCQTAGAQHDAFSFDPDAGGLDIAYDQHQTAFMH